MSEPRLIHILGGGQWQLPSVMLAKALGYRVLVTDMYAQPPAAGHADEFVQVDITDREATLEVARRHRIHGIVCDTTDVGVPTMAYVAEALGLPGIGLETALNFTNKFRMRQLTSAAGVPNPPFHLARTLAEFRQASRDLGLPAVVKPVDNQSSRGVHIVRQGSHGEHAFEDAIRHSRRREAIVEGFLDGIEITVEGYCVDGQPGIAGISDKDHFAHRPEVANRLTYPADLEPAVIDRVRATNERVVRALGLRTGVTHAEYMVIGCEVFLVEIAARGGGTRVYSHIAPFLAGFPIPEFYFRHVMGETPVVRPSTTERAANLAFFLISSGRVKEIAGVEDALAVPGVAEILLEVQPGDVIQPPQDDRSRHGHVLVFGARRSDVLGATARVFDLVRVDVA